MLEATVSAPVALRERAAAYVELTKPGIVRMVLITAGAGFVLAAGTAMDFLLLLHTLIGMGLVASGSCGLNQFMERDADGRMKRTASRPIPSGRVTPLAAAVFSSVLSLAGLVYLSLFVGPGTTWLTLLSLATYTLIYTPLKRVSWLATWVGAVPGALPILAGWTAGGGSLNAAGLALFGILFMWQMPHFYALEWIYRADYARGGFKLLTLNDATGSRMAVGVVGFALALVAVSVTPSLLHVTGALYLGAAVVLGALFLGLGIALALQRNDKRAMRLFLASVAYLPLLLLIMIVDRLIR
jgi:protoheme IX farnesyltransferase